MLTDSVKLMKLKWLLILVADIKCTVVFSMSGEVEVVKGSVSIFILNLANRSSPTYQSNKPLVPRFRASHVRVSIPGHCSPDSANDPILELS